MTGDRIERIKAICARYQGNDYFEEEGIPQRKLQNAREKYGMPEQERVLALIDTTVFGSAKNGLAICPSGLYWNNDWQNRSSQTSLTWEQFARGSVSISSDRFDIYFMDDIWVNISGSGFPEEKMVHLLRDLHSEIALGLQLDVHEPPQPPRPSAAWLVAMDGEQFGPFDLPTIERMLQDGKIVAEESFVWSQGMTDWKPFLAEPVFQKMVEQLVAQLEQKRVVPPPPKAVKQEVASASSSDAGKIDVNTAIYEDLLVLPGIGAAEARRLIAHRERTGGFASLEQVEELLDLKPHHAKRWDGLVRFSPVQAKDTRSGRVIDF